MNFSLSPARDFTYNMPATSRFAPGRAPAVVQDEISAHRGASSAATASLPYVRVAHTQGTPEWREWRQQGIGASDAATIMGENPYKTSEELMVEKFAGFPEPTKNYKMALGVRLEPEARLEYCLACGTELEPVCLQSTQRGWLRASLDGLSSDGRRVVEIKCGNAAYWQTLAKNRPPGYYHGQLQHILAVTGLHTIDFVCYIPPAMPICLTIERDEEYITRLLRAEEAFWKRLMKLRDRFNPVTRESGE